MTTEILLVHAGATLYMTGLIWFVQVVHYPLFRLVGEGPFRAYSREHQTRTTWVVAPVMVLEAATALALVLRLSSGTERLAAWIGLALLAAIWLSTALIQVPLHRRLLNGYGERFIGQLVHSNWFRTFGWTLRAALALWLVRPGALV